MNKLAIVGTAPSGAAAPFDDVSYDIWGCGSRYKHVTRATRWYELHRLEGELLEWAEGWRKLMRDEWPHDCEVWMFYPEPDLGKSVVHFLPEPLLEKYGSFFMTSSFAWMMAQALEEGYRDISLYGVDMEYDTEYAHQRTGVQFFIRLALLQGVNVHLVATSGLAHQPIAYPFWQDDPLRTKAKLRRASLTERKASSKRAFEGLQSQLIKTEGSLAALEDLLRIPPEIDPRTMAQAQIARLRQQFLEIRAEAELARDHAKVAEGALAELDWLEAYLQS